MPGNDANISRDIFDERKRYIRTINQQGIHWVDADENDGKESTLKYLRRTIQSTMGDGFVNDGFKIRECDNDGIRYNGNVNNFVIVGQDLSISPRTKVDIDDGSSAGAYFIDGIRCSLFGDVIFTANNPIPSGSGNPDEVSQESIFPRVTDIDFSGSDTIITDSAANYVVNELQGRDISFLNGMGSPDTFTIASNTANTITVSGTNLTGDVYVYDRYRIDLSTPSGSDRTDAVYLNVYLDQVNAAEDQNLYHNVGTPVEAQIREQVIQEIFVREDVTGNGELTNYVDSDGNQHYVQKLVEIERLDGDNTITSSMIKADNTIEFGTKLQNSPFETYGSSKHANDSSDTDNMPVDGTWPNAPGSVPDGGYWIAREDDDQGNSSGFYVNSSGTWTWMFEVEVEYASDISYTNNSGGTDTYLPPPMTNPNVDDSLSSLSDGISSIKTYDKVINRADYASDSDAGDAIGLALGSPGIETLFIKEGTYEFGDSEVLSLGVDVMLIAEEGTDFKWTSSSTIGAGIQLSAGNILENIRAYVVGGGNAGATNGLFYGANNPALLINCESSGSAGYGFNAITGTSSTGLYNCKVYNSTDSAYYECDNINGCTLASCDTDGFENCERISNCYAINDASSAFVSCNKINNCSVVMDSTATGVGFSSCEDINNCSVDHIDGYGSYSFYQCKRVSNSKGMNGDTNVFRECEHLSNCIGVNPYNYVFFSCNYLNNCDIEVESGESNITNSVYYQCNNLDGCRATKCDGSGFRECNNLSSCNAINTVGAGFYQCKNISGSKADSCANGFVSSSGQIVGCEADNNDNVGFLSCNNLSGCLATTNIDEGFSGCNSISGSEAVSNGSDGFKTCDRVSACYADSNTLDGFDSCNYVSGCQGSGNSGYDFESCDYVSASYSVAGTSGWNNAGSNVDSDSCNNI